MRSLCLVTLVLFLSGLACRGPLAAACSCPTYDVYGIDRTVCLDARLRDAGIDPGQSCDAPWLVQGKNIVPLPFGVGGKERYCASAEADAADRLAWYNRCVANDECSMREDSSGCFVAINRSRIEETALALESMRARAAAGGCEWSGPKCGEGTPRCVSRACILLIPDGGK